MDEFPGNSRQHTPSDKKPQEEVAKLEPVVTGKVIKRKKPLGRRIMETFFTGDGGGVFNYLLKEVLVPAMQDLATDVVKQGIERAVYGEVRSPRTNRYNSSSTARTHISYDRYNTRPNPPSPPMRRPVTQPDSIEIGMVVLDSKVEAQAVAQKLFETVDTYGCATVANLNELLNQSSVYTDHKYGWTNLDSVQVHRYRDGWYVDLPRPVDLG